MYALPLVHHQNKTYHSQKRAQAVEVTMPKRVHDENEAETKAEKPPAACAFCSRMFTARGMTRHQNKCAKKQAHDSAAAKKPRAYRFSILNEAVFEHVLEFLSNQSLTKLQMLTGDRYDRCEPELARYCCQCENDNPVMLNGLCRECESELPTYMPCTTKETAKTHYGVRDKDFPRIPCQVRKHYTLFDRITLEDHMIRTCGSKMAWVRDIAKRDTRKKKLNATLHKKEKEETKFLESLAPGFAVYIASVGFKKTDKEVLQEWSRRYVVLIQALQVRRLKLWEDSRLCNDFITAGFGQVEEVVDTMEEMNFLFAHTSYSRRCENKIHNMCDNGLSEWYPRGEFREMMQDCRNEAKIELCIEYLEDRKGLTLPRKWERCRQRFDTVRASGASPMQKRNHIYGA
ncbi:unnamed protein product [Phytophthora fragariaefolia]|uniref:Unnamed protein product n=1 Tax=Phytophthora fragariaefolia TaxID=1490495 RepID=A0A9W6U8J9_9STRA|nr:unnamed protein product [Phytophthora fragariaefolia]